MDRTIALLLTAPALAFGLVAAPVAAFAAGGGATAQASGSAEVGGKGDPAASANATFSFDTAGKKVCYSVTASGLKAVAMHIHKGAAGANGPVVVALDAAKVGAGTVCAAAAGDVVAAVAADPAGYYFNAHTRDFPAGAVRGQLVATAGAAASTPSSVAAGTGGQAADSGSSSVPLVLLLVGGIAAGAASWRLARR